MRARALLAGAGVLALGAAVGLLLTGRMAPRGQPGNADLAAGEMLYQAHCAACHGVGLEGQPEWQSPGADGLLPAPPHDETGHTWHHGDGLLFTYTKLGGTETLARQGLEFESGMPGFGETLSDREIWDILAFIKSTWPERMREVQAARTEAERRQGGT